MKEFTLPPLPYGYESLVPFISSDTLHYHHDKHHKAYVDASNKLLMENPSIQALVEKKDGKLSEIVVDAYSDHPTFFNNISQHLNHSFLWESMNPPSVDKKIPRPILAKYFGSYDEFLDLFVKKGLAQFGSGWVWLVYRDKELAVISTPNAESPFLLPDTVPVFTCDVWEHAYYLDYQNRRVDYLKAFVEKLINWNKVDETLSRL